VFIIYVMSLIYMYTLIKQYVIRIFVFVYDTNRLRIKLKLGRMTDDIFCYLKNCDVSCNIDVVDNIPGNRCRVRSWISLIFRRTWLYL